MVYKLTQRNLHIEIERLNPEAKSDLKKIKRLVGLYNMVPNIIWSIINLVPISVFCYTILDLRLFYIFLFTSFLPVFFPNSFFDKMQFGKTLAIYKKLGVGVVNKLSQNGDIINSLIRKKFPAYRAVRHNKSSINKLVQQTYVFEKFHFFMFLFFIFTTAYAISKNYFGWGAVIILTNLLYNIYPNLLQQYIRLRLKLHDRKANISTDREEVML
jgi:hypothetical protein